MRRRLLWTTGILLLLIAAGIIVIARKPTAPFNFLAPYKPLAEVTFSASSSEKLACYSFKTDYESFEPEAIRELRDRGYHELSPLLYPRPGRRFELTDPSDPNKVHAVTLRRDAFYWQAGNPPPADQTGWTSVIIEGDPPPTLLDQIRTWLGL